MWTVKVDMGNVKSKITEALDAGQKALDSEVLKDSNYYIPLDTGNLRDSGITATKIGSGKVVWSAKYARENYFSSRRFSKDRNPRASSLWFEWAKVKNRTKWLEVADKATRSRL